MSAFICENDHFKALAIFATSRDHFGIRVAPQYTKGLEALQGLPSCKMASEYAGVLYRENVRSVLARYPQDKASDYDNSVIVTNADECKTAYLALTPVAILKMCDCLEYQSCETEDYRASVAFDLLDRIRGAAIKALPGYENAPWSYQIKERKHG